MKFRKITLLLTVFIFLIFILSGCEKKNDTTVKLNKFMSAYNKNCSYKYNGVILVAKGDNILFSESYGTANYKADIPNAIDSVFPIGSITKSFTAIAIMQLQEKGLLNVDDYISQYINHNRGDDITIHQLLTHTSGLCRDGKLSKYQQVSLIENVDFIDKCSMLFEPGENMSYSNAGYIILAAIIEKVSGVSYNDYINDNIVLPLNMDDSRGGIDDSIADNQSIGYNILTGTPKRLSIYNFSSITGSGNIYSTVEDLYKYDRGIQSEKLLTKDSFDEIFTDWGNGYGYGWNITERYGHKKISHGGCIGKGGYTSLMIRYPDDDYVLIFLTNNADNTALNAVSDTMEAIIFKEDYIMPEKVKNVKVDPEILKQYAGDYDFEQGFILSVTYKNEKIYSYADDGNEYELIPISKTTFYYEDHQCVRGEFVLDEDNNEITYKIQSRTSVVEGKKMKN